MKRLCHISASGAALVAVVGLAACGSGGGGSGDVVAQVNGRPITKTTLDHWTSIQAANDQMASSQTGNTPRQQALSFLISSEWTIGEAAELGVGVTDGEAQRQLTLFKYDQLEKFGEQGLFPKEAELKESLARRGLTRSDQLRLMKLNMLAAKIGQKRFSNTQQGIAPAQIAAYYEENKQRFVVPERRDLEWIVTYSKAVTTKAMREVQSGKNFLSVAKGVTLDPPTMTGLEPSFREKDFAKQVFAAKPHVLVGPLRQSHNYYTFRVTKVTPARQQTLAQSEASIRRQLATRQQQQASASLAENLERMWTARTSCRTGYVVPKCRQYVGSTPAAASSSPYPETSGTSGSASSTANAGVVVSTKRVKLGTILAAGPKNLTVYLFEGDRGSTPACYGGCAQVWRPVITTGAPRVGGMAIPADLGTTTRSDGTKQVTYFHHPLYYYAKDRDSGDVYGEGVKSFGSDWYALRTIGVKFEKP